MLLKKIDELIFPSSLYCICCGNLVDASRSYALCDYCMRHIKWDREKPRKYRGMLAVRCAEYGIFERSIIFALKYEGHRYIARNVAEMMKDKLISIGCENMLSEMIVVPVPLHKKKELTRGYNQAVLIGKYLAKSTGMEFAPRALERVRETRPMRGLGPEERQANIDGAFAMAAGAEGFAEGKRILLLDDFFTTGSTAASCRKALAESGAREIILMAFAAKYSEDAGEEE